MELSGVLMNKNKNYVYIYAVLLGFTFIWWLLFARPSEDLNKYICRDSELVEYSIKAYKNNLSQLAQFHYKRVESCLDLMEVNKTDRNPIRRIERCGVLDALTESAVPLSQLLLANGEIPTAKDELLKIIKAMEPYSYCGVTYESNLKAIIKMKKLSDM